MSGKKFDDAIIIRQIESKKKDAESLLKDADRMSDFFKKLEKKMKGIKLKGVQFETVPLLVALIKDYAKGDYHEIDLKTIIFILATLIYVVSPVDLIPDAIPGAGLIDDLGVVTFCLEKVNSEIKKYKKWRGARA